MQDVVEELGEEDEDCFPSLKKYDDLIGWFSAFFSECVLS